MNHFELQSLFELAMNIWNLWDSAFFIKSFLYFQSNFTWILPTDSIPNTSITFSNICVQINLTVHFSTSLTISHRCPQFLFLSVCNRLLLIEYNKILVSARHPKLYRKPWDTAQPAHKIFVGAHPLSHLSAEAISFEYSMTKACLCTSQRTIVKALFYELHNEGFVNLLLSIHIHPELQFQILGCSHLPTYTEVWEQV